MPRSMEPVAYPSRPHVAAGWILALSVGVLPLVHWPLAVDANLAKPLLVAVVVLMVGALIAWMFLRREWPQVRWSVTDLSVAAYAVFGVLSLTYSHYPGSTLDAIRPLLLSAAFYLCARLCLSLAASRVRLALALVAGCAVVSALGVAEQFGALPWGQPGEVRSTWFNRTYLAAHLLLVLPVAIWLALRAGWASRVVGAAATLLGGVALVFSGARISYVALLPMAVVVVVAGWPITSATWRRRVAAVGIGMVALSLFVHAASDRVPLLPSPARVIVDAFAPDASGSNQLRSALMVAAVRIGRERPILGWGAGTYGIYSVAKLPRDPYSTIARNEPTKPAIVPTHAHNEFLEVFAELGGLGVVVFAAIPISAWSVALRTVRWNGVSLDEKRLAIALTAGMVGFLCANLVGVSMRVPGEACLFYASVALLLSLGAPVAYSQAPTGNGPLRAAAVGPALILCSLIGWTYLTECRASVHIGAGEALLGQYGSVGNAAAADAFRAACRLLPSSARAHYGLGNALGLLGRSDEALSEFEVVERLWPHYGRVHFNKGTCYAQLGRLRDAEREIRLAYWQDRLPDSRETLRWLRGQLRQPGGSEGQP